MKYNILIEETISEEFEVDANSPEEALEVAREKYKSGEFVLKPGNLIECKIGIASDSGVLEWEEM